MQINWELNFQLEKWVLILKVLVFNTVTSLSLLAVLNFLGKFKGIEQFKEVGHLAVFFNSFSLTNFWVFFREYCAMGPTAEEMFYRLPVFLLTTQRFEWFIGDRNFAKFVLWLSLIIPTGFWALDHEPFPLPVFITGLTYGWLIIKTRPSWPWPAIICHSLSNLSIYILVKILQYLGHAPVIT